MITEIAVRHFKCFRDQSVPFAPLTLLTGPNASGKSSVLQPLLLLSQSIRVNRYTDRLVLNGPLVNAGTVAEVVDNLSGRYSIYVDISTARTSVGWTFTGGRNDMSFEVEQLRHEAQPQERTRPLELLLPHTMKGPPRELLSAIAGLTYLGAERVGPRDFYQLEDAATARSVSPNGENVLGILSCFGGREVLPGLQLPTHNTLAAQVGAWMQLLFPGFALDVQPLPRTSSATLGMRVQAATEFHRPTHIGFGLTQVLPMIVAVLACDEEDLVLVENPEVHLHPAAQSKIGRFLATAAAAGVQVMVETHSDHVLNGVRRAVKSGTIAAEQTRILYFQPRETGAQVIVPEIDANGRIDHWPTGFFDQYDEDINKLADW